MLERRPFNLSEKTYGENQLKRGRDLLERYLPIFLPQEPTAILFRRIADAARYEAKLRGIHYLSLSTTISLNPTNRQFQEVYNQYCILHELTHQRLAEEIGQSLWHGFFDPEAYITDEEFGKKTQAKLLDKLWGGKTHKDGLLTDAISEGVAFFAELYVCERDLQEAKREKYRNRINALTTLQKSIVEVLSKSKNSLGTDRSEYQGFRAVNKIFRRFGLQGLANFIRSTDFEACNYISIGSEAYQVAIRNPMLIPKKNKSDLL